MLKPICVQCQRFYRPKKTGVYFVESKQRPDEFGLPALPGRATPEQWQPYKVWAGDLWHCPDCGHELISGTGMHPIVEDYQADFLLTIGHLNALWLEVKDC
jgi:hypothetical protein